MFETTLKDVINVEAVVVANDVAQAKTEATTYAADLLVQLEARRISWEQGTYRKSNQELYGILADCLQYAGPLMTAEANKTRKDLLAKFYKERGYRLKSDTPLATQVVRAVFGNTDRRRISTYSLVVRKAKKDGVLPNQLAQWIEDNGGVQEIRLGHSATYVSPTQKAEIAKGFVSDLPTLAVVKSAELSLQADAEHMGEDCVLLATQQADGSFIVKAMLRGTSVKAAYEALYTATKDDFAKAAAEKVAANDAQGKVAKAA